MKNYHNDQPITGEPESPDLLNRSSFSQRLASLLKIDPGENCMTVSLEGDWGCGKTSVINLTKTILLKEQYAPIVVEYNPWLTGNAETLVQDFLVQLSAQFKVPDRPKEGMEAAKELLAYSKLFGALKFIPGAEPWASTLQNVLDAVGNTSKDIGELKELNLLERKQRINKTLSDLGKSIVVIIDDIDRLTPDEAYQVIRLVKAVADFHGTSFLLSYEPSYLAKSLQRHGIDNAAQYLDKIVQVRVPLPLIAHRDLPLCQASCRLYLHVEEIENENKIHPSLQAASGRESA